MLDQSHCMIKCYVTSYMPLCYTHFLILYTQLHVKECPNVEEVCNLGCGALLPRALREQHASECAKRLTSCSYCGFSIPMDALEVGVCVATKVIISVWTIEH